MRASEGVRVLFMPHSPGVYIALVLRNAEDLEKENTLTSKDMNTTSEGASFKNSVQRLIIQNNLFLDIDSLSKNLQTILK
jgi:hypothetical protein